MRTEVRGMLKQKPAGLHNPAGVQNKMVLLLGQDCGALLVILFRRDLVSPILAQQFRKLG